MLSQLCMLLMLVSVQGLTFYNVTMELFDTPRNPGGVVNYCFYEDWQGSCSMFYHPFPGEAWVRRSTQNGYITYIFGDSDLASFSVPFTTEPIYFDVEISSKCVECGSGFNVVKNDTSMTFNADGPSCTIPYPYNTTCTIDGIGTYGYDQTKELFMSKSSINRGNYNISAIWVNNTTSSVGMSISLNVPFIQKLKMSYNIFETCTTSSPTLSPTPSPTPIPGAPTLSPTPSPTSMSNTTHHSGEVDVSKNIFDIAVSVSVIGGFIIGVITGLCMSRRRKESGVPLLTSVDYDSV